MEDFDHLEAFSNDKYSNGAGPKSNTVLELSLESNHYLMGFHGWL